MKDHHFGTSFKYLGCGTSMLQVQTGERNRYCDGALILEDIQKVIALLQEDKAHSPFEMLVADDVIVAHGGNPDDFPAHPDYPGIRVLRSKQP